VLLNAADAVERSAEELARLLSREQGKPLNGPNARFEVGACAAWLRVAAATVLEPETLVEDGETYAQLHYKPIGVVGAIGPWNWPMMITVWQIAPALRMGNAVVVKPSEYTRLSVLALVKVINQELPEGLLTVVNGGRDAGARLAEHPAIGKIMFTGSTATGKAIVRSSADTVKRLTLELGGNDAGIVLPDADPKAIAQDLFWGAFINTGQTCAALKRLYVHTDIYDAVCQELTSVAAAMPMGNGLDENNVLGPLQNKAQYNVVANLVEAARASGAHILLGGNPDAGQPGYFYPTTLVADIERLTHHRGGSGPAGQLAAGPAGQLLALALPPVVLVLVVVKPEDNGHQHEHAHHHVNPGRQHQRNQDGHAVGNDRRYSKRPENRAGHITPVRPWDGQGTHHVEADADNHHRLPQGQQDLAGNGAAE
jgi:phenylacetaldehyde dehydrogenase